MEHSDRENAKRAIEEVHKKYNAAASTEQQRQAQPVAAASTADKDNSDAADLTKLLARAVGQSGDDEEDVNGKAFFKIKLVYAQVILCSKCLDRLLPLLHVL